MADPAALQAACEQHGYRFVHGSQRSKAWLG